MYVYSIADSVINKHVLYFRRTMSLVRSHMSSGENFFMVVLRFLETFVGSMSAGLLLAPCCKSSSSCFHVFSAIYHLKVDTELSCR